MAVKKTKERPKSALSSNAYIENAGIIIDQPIVETLEKNYMPYAMSVIVSRAIPEIDGLKPSHRKILYTMYKMGLLGTNRTKSANVVGQTMRLHPHGDTAIYETMVRMSRGYQSLLHPFVDSKGNFGKAYSRDMAFAASRYTEVKLDSICGELFNDIDKDTVDFVDNYDRTMSEPTLLPVSFPSILVNSNMGIAVGMASSICSFNLSEICEATIGLLKNPSYDITQVIKAPDFPLGGQILYDATEMNKIFTTGRGSVRVRSVYVYDKANNCIEVTEIPSSTTVEAIIDKIVELVKNGKIREVSDVRDETDLSGLKLTIDLKRGTDSDKLMQKLFKMTPLEDNFACNFNILIAGNPKVMGVTEILSEWIAFRIQNVKRRIHFDLKKKIEKLHLLKGLKAILIDIDKAVRIVRETESETEVTPNLMIGFSIDEIQAEYVAEIKLRHLNREYIIKRIEEIDILEKDIESMKSTLEDPQKTKNIIAIELRNVIKKFGNTRKSIIIEPDFEENFDEPEEIPDYPVNLFFTKEGYFKKITPQSLRMSGEQKLKEGDEIRQKIEASNANYLLFFTDKGQVYKARANDFDDTKSSVMGEYLPAKFSMDDGELPIYVVITDDYKGFILFAFENGKVAKVSMSSYETKTNRRKLTGAYSSKSPIMSIMALKEETDIVVKASNGKIFVISTSILESKTARAALGVSVLAVKGKTILSEIENLNASKIVSKEKFRAKSIPSIGFIAKLGDIREN